MIMEGCGFALLLRIKGDTNLYTITQKESFELRKMFPNISIKICSRRKKGAGSKTYYCEEGKHIKKALDDLRRTEVGDG